VLGIGPIGLNDALAAPMSEVFDRNAANWTYKAIVPRVLRSTKLPLPPDEHANVSFPRYTAAYWAKAMVGQDFSGPDRIDPVSFNRALWRGLKGEEPYPVHANEADRRRKEMKNEALLSTALAFRAASSATKGQKGDKPRTPRPVGDVWPAPSGSLWCGWKTFWPIISRPIQPPAMGPVVEIPQVGLHHLYTRKAA
jgi:hypothetical protein